MSWSLRQKKFVVYCLKFYFSKSFLDSSSNKNWLSVRQKVWRPCGKKTPAGLAVLTGRYGLFPFVLTGRLTNYPDICQSFGGETLRRINSSFPKILIKTALERFHNGWIPFVFLLGLSLSGLRSVISLVCLNLLMETIPRVPVLIPDVNILDLYAMSSALVHTEMDAQLLQTQTGTINLCSPKSLTLFLFPLGEENLPYPHVLFFFQQFIHLTI